MKIAHMIEIQPKTGQIFIEGVEFDFYVKEAPEVDTSEMGGQVALVTLSVYADNVVYGERHVFSTMDQETRERAQLESAWARREARRIVHEGMADVLKWLSGAAVEQMDGFPQRYVAGLPNGSPATKINDTY